MKTLDRAGGRAPRARLLPGSTALLLLLAGVQGAHAAEPATVNCHDPARRIVQTVRPHECDGRAVSDAEARRIRERERRRRAAILQERPREAARPPAGRIGSGFLVGNGGHVVTAAHVVSDCRAIAIEGPDLPRRPARAVEVSEAADVAVLAVTATPGAHPWPSAGPRKTDVSARVVALGYPLRGAAAIRPVETTGEVVDAAARVNGRPSVVFRAEIHGGNSGGPLVTPAGELVGMVSARIDTVATYAQTGKVVRDLAFAVPAAALRRELRRADVAWESAGTAAPGLERLRRSVVRVRCQRLGGGGAE